MEYGHSVHNSEQSLKSGMSGFGEKNRAQKVSQEPLHRPQSSWALLGVTPFTE